MASTLPIEIVKQNLKLILEQVKAVAQRVNSSQSPRLIAVGKTFPGELTEACYNVGQRHFGENYVQELEEKSVQLAESCPEIKWHYIGRVQSNKIKKICGIHNLWCVETVESQKHCELFQKHMAELNKKLNIFVQVNTSGEENKGGVEPIELPTLVEFILQNCQNLTFKGLMTIGSIVESKSREKNADFELLRKLRAEICDKFKLNQSDVELSMGMTNDFEMAIEYGSTNVRVGSAIFGSRYYPNKQ